ncbi:MAG: SRPBCC family protein [Steroidobacteraceae bacterium]
MDITNSFELPLDPALAWSVLLDIPRIMPCIPGAELLEIIDDSNYKGKVSVKLGPVSLAFVGTATVVERNAGARRAQLKAKGQDSKGRGGVLAEMTFDVAAAATGSSVTVLTRVSFTGSVAQYGRGTGVIQGVASELIAQFARNLEASLLRSASATVAPSQPGSVPSRRHEAVVRPDAALTGDPSNAASPLVPASKPIAGFSLLLKVLWGLISGPFRRDR